MELSISVIDHKLIMDIHMYINRCWILFIDIYINGEVFSTLAYHISGNPLAQVFSGPTPCLV